MKKLALATILAAAVYGGWRWQQPSDTANRHLAFNRIWVDHLPTSEKDVVHMFAAFRNWSQGGFADETRWHGEVERFRFELHGDELHAVFPWKGDRETIKVHAYRCQENDMDYCLEISGNSRGATKYYSRSGWERGSVEDIEAFRTTLFK